MRGLAYSANDQSCLRTVDGVDDILQSLLVLLLITFYVELNNKFQYEVWLKVVYYVCITQRNLNLNAIRNLSRANWMWECVSVFGCLLLAIKL